MADYSYESYLAKLGGAPTGSNAAANPALYIPQGVSVKEFEDANGDPGRVGLFSPNTVQMNTSPMERKFALETLFHEGAHTMQPYLPNFLNPNTNKLSGVPYEGYLDPQDARPTTKINEVLASLRAKDAMLPKGKSSLDTPEGRNYVNAVAKQNSMKPQEARDYVNNAIYKQDVLKEWAKKYFAK